MRASRQTDRECLTQTSDDVTHDTLLFVYGTRSAAQCVTLTGNCIENCCRNIEMSGQNKVMVRVTLYAFMVQLFVILHFGLYYVVVHSTVTTFM